MLRTIFITGATGFLGSHVVKAVLEDPNNAVVLLARDKGARAAEQRALHACTALFGDEERSATRDRIEVVNGDIALPCLGIAERQARELCERLDAIIHCAAKTKFNAPLSHLRRINVAGTQNVLDFGLRCMEQGRLQDVAHVSTSFSAMKLRGRVCERFYGTPLRIRLFRFLKRAPLFNGLLRSRFFFRQLEFLNYTQTKLEAELLARKYRRRGLNISIFRPSAVVGHSRTGAAADFNSMYLMLQVLSNIEPSAVPFCADTPVNLVPVDSAAEAICLIALTEEHKNGIYNIVHPQPVTLSFWIEQASRYFGFMQPDLVPIRQFDMAGLTRFEKKLFDPFMLGANSNISYDSTHTTRLLKRHGFKWPRMDEGQLERMFAYCEEVNFLSRKRK